MGKVRIPILTEAQEKSLRHGYEDGKGKSFRKRCHMVLLKSQGYTSKQITAILGGCQVVVNTWLDRFEAEGVEGLRNKPGQGKKPILDATSDRERIDEAVKNNRQQLNFCMLDFKHLHSSTCPNRAISQRRRLVQ